MNNAAKGFTLIELTVVLVIAGLLLSLTGPSVRSFYETVKYRETVRELTSAAKNARRWARANGKAYDLVIDPIQNRFALTSQAASLKQRDYKTLAQNLDIEFVYAAEVSSVGDLGAIRFYPSGGSSGGEIIIQRPSGSGIQLTIDWLLGDVSQEEL